LTLTEKEEEVVTFDEQTLMRN